MKRTRIFLSVVTFIVFLSSMSFANGLNLNGIGPRAVAMGGAFVGLADDYSAVFWNPAGLANIKQKYIAFYGFDITPSMTYKLEVDTPIGTITAVDAKSVTKHYLGGLAGYYHPLSENLVAGLAVYSPSGLGIEWDGSDLAAISGGKSNIEWMTKIFMVTIAPSLAYQVNDQFQLGVALNINYASFDTAQYAGTASTPLGGVDLGQQKLEMTGWGFGATFGLLVKPSDMFSLGATFRTPSKIGFSGDTTISGFNQLGLSTSSGVETDVTWPMWLAGGIAFKPIEQFTLTADVQWTQWSKLDVLDLTFSDQAWRLLMEVSEGDKFYLKWEDATQIRFGAEYWLSPKFALRAGFYIDPGPAPDETRNILLPITDFTSFAGGIGYNINGIVIDLAVEYLTGKEKENPYLKTLTDPAYEHAMPGTFHLKHILSLELAIGYKW